MNFIKYALIILLFSVAWSAVVYFALKDNKKPDFYIDGQPYRIRTACLRDTTINEYGYHYGYNVLNRKVQYHYGWHRVTKCIHKKTDTVLYEYTNK